MKNYILIYALLAFELLNAQTKDTINVAVFLYDGVELLDFSGPAEVFAASSYYTNSYHFNVYTVAKEPQLTSQGFLTITPNYNFNNSPKTDVLILPGGNANDAINDSLTKKWIVKEIKNSTDVLTVCSGIFFLKDPGFLEDIKLTSHHKIIPFLKQTFDPEDVVENVKYVDSGQIVTSAGVSSGIEGAFLTLSKIAGYEVANRTARYMEYPYWHISNGKMTYSITSLASKFLANQNDKPKFGVLDVAGHIALREKNLEEAIKYFQKNKSLYPSSALSYFSLASAFKRINKWVPPVYEDFINVLRNQGAKEAFKIFQKTKSVYPNWVLFTLKDITVRIDNLINQKNYSEAELVSKMAMDTYPENSISYVQKIKILIELEKKIKAQKTLTLGLNKFPDNKELLTLQQKLNSK
ncbi:DJ-1/PfpI family protein [Aquimarina gracilis]|uniref:DJ-1/PfpI family protein n=1 Tax=Aquimarina gracilis TaxID=874422 RepID=A0ABU5ZYX3_9FLAO|nr:DJ-1/PfpI family protein [Aquimarina gracilis]MEB3347089.1 DJ-1/PfpI family protein [Aquimarina gracilis]